MGIWIPILALAIPVLAVFFNGIQKVYQPRLDEARLRAGGPDADGADIEELRAEVEQLRRELGEVHERLDFTERLLSKTPERDRVPGASSPPVP